MRCILCSYETRLNAKTPSEETPKRMIRPLPSYLGVLAFNVLCL